MTKGQHGSRFRSPKVQNDFNVDLTETIKRLHEKAQSINQKMKNSRPTEEKIVADFKSVRTFMKSLDIKKKQSRLTIA